MNMREGMGKIWRWTQGAFAGPTPGNDDSFLYGYGAEDPYRFNYGYSPVAALWRGLGGRSPEIAEVQQEVAAEMRGQVLLVGLDDEALRGLLARLRGRPPVPPAGPIYREGFFTLATLPVAPTAGWEDEASGLALSLAEVLGLVGEADVVLYVYATSLGWQEADDRWYARLRVAGRPVILVEARDGPSAGADGLPPTVFRPVEVQLEPDVDGGEGDADLLALASRILGRCDRLAVPLAQEVPACRPMVAGRIVRSAALAAALLGAEPIPLLDLPLQVAVNWRMALQLAVIYGHGPLDYRSRGMIGTVVWNLGLRGLVQQICKLVPVLGWAASAGLTGSATWLLGNGLRRYFEDEERWHEAPAVLRMALEGRRQQIGGRIKQWGCRVTRWFGHRRRR